MFANRFILGLKNSGDLVIDIFWDLKESWGLLNDLFLGLKRLCSWLILGLAKRCLLIWGLLILGFSNRGELIGFS